MNSSPAASDVLRSSTPVLALGDLNGLLVATDRDFLYTQCRRKKGVMLSSFTLRVLERRFDA